MDLIAFLFYAGGVAAFPDQRFFPSLFWPYYLGRAVAVWAHTFNLASKED